ncbi:MAG: ThiF family adenylyltransferase, partial [Pseudomonadota bacterium]|nr:ThiF family adenylyltransferase [Pseudomonadota bacterium]
MKNKSSKSKMNLEKYSRQLILREIGSEGQKRINQSKVLIIGLGGLGSSVLQYLSSAGVGMIGIVDHDKIQLSNMNRQVIYKDNDIGKNKVDIAEKFSKELNPSINIKKYRTKISEKNIEEII